MKKILVLCALVALMLGACTVEKRVVTAKHKAGNIFYTAYFEWEETYFFVWNWFHNDFSKIKRCNLRDDNTLACIDEQEVETILNPQHHGDVDRTSGAPEESAAPAPAEEAAPAEAAPAEEAPAEEAPAEEAPAEEEAPVE